MEDIKIQFAELTKQIRDKNDLTQDALAKKLDLASKNSIHEYEKGKKMMRLDGFVEFIQMFNEKVVIDRNGIHLEENNKNLRLIEEKGDIRFYEDVNTGIEYQKVPSIGLMPVVDGRIEYQTIQSFGDISIKYNTNGCYGYSIWSGEKCLEDNYWIKKQIEESVKELFLNTQKEKTIEVMIMNLEIKLENEGLSLNDLDFNSPSTMLSSLDYIFRDGGEFRCEYFTDIAIPYSLNFGIIESNVFMEAQWECIDEVYNRLLNIKDNN